MPFISTLGIYLHGYLINWIGRQICSTSKALKLGRSRPLLPCTSIKHFTSWWLSVSMPLMLSICTSEFTRDLLMPHSVWLFANVHLLLYSTSLHIPKRGFSHCSDTNEYKFPFAIWSVTFSMFPSNNIILCLGLAASCVSKHLFMSTGPRSVKKELPIHLHKWVDSLLYVCTYFQGLGWGSMNTTTKMLRSTMSIPYKYNAYISRVWQYCEE
jgi:hypothetical protein